MPLRRLTLHSHPVPMRYGVATAIFIAALALRLVALPVEARAGFLTFYPAMVLVFYLCGTGPGLWVLLLSAASGFYIFYPPFWSWSVTPTSVLTTLSFVGSSLVIALVMRTLQNTNRRLTDALAKVELSDARWKAMVDDQMDVVVRFDAQGAVLVANQVAQRMFGASARPGERGSWKEAVHPEDLPRVLERLAALNSAKTHIRFDCRVRDVEGQWHWVEFVDHAFYDAAGHLVEIQSVGRDVSERRTLEEHLRATEAELRDLYDNAPCGYYSLDALGHFLRVNKAVEALLGKPAVELLQITGPRDFATEQSQPVFDASFRRLKEDAISEPYELELVSASGERRNVRIYATSLRNAEGVFERTRSAMVDVTEVTETRQALEEVVREQHAMLNNDLVGIIKLRQRTAVWVNRAFERMFGFDPGELMGTSARVLYPDDETFEHIGRDAYPILRSAGTFRRQALLVKKNGAPVWVDISGSMLSLAHDESMWMMLDISALKANELRMEDMAHHDALTGLPNRVLLMELLKHELATRQRLGDELAVCFVDLDGFKPINDRHGHDAGDKVLQTMGERLQESVRGHDIVARLGGDEFVVVLTHLSDAVVVRDTLQRLLERLRGPITLANGALVSVSASLGVAICPADGDSVPILLRRADEAMYAAKGAGRNQIRFFADIT